MSPTDRRIDSTREQAILDACVLVNAALRDTLLRLAEPPHLYLPRWTNEIILETQRTLEAKLGLSPAQTAHLAGELQVHFPEAWVEGYEPLIPLMQNHLKDRHVLAATVRCGFHVLVTFNLKDFPESALTGWNVEAVSPDSFLMDQWTRDPEVVAAKLQEQAARHGGMTRLMAIDAKTLPGFVALLQQTVG